MQGKLFNMRVPFTVITALAAQVAWAGPPVPFNNWNVNQGTIASPCPNGFSCVNVVDGSGGFLQRELIEQGTGRTFLQSILTDSGANGQPSALGFADENFIQLKGAGGQQNQTGISASQRIADPNTFESTIVFNRGWAAEPGTAGDGRITQVLRDPGNPTLSTDDFESRFSFQGVASEAGRAGRRVEIGQTLGLNQGETSELNNWQVMRMVVVEGDLQTTAGGATLPGAGTVNWQPGDTIVAGWVGQVFQTPLGASDQPSAFSHAAFMNQTTGTQAVFNSLSDADPITWPDPFGPAPSIPSVPTAP